MKISRIRNKKNPLIWTDSQLKIELEEMRCGRKLTTQLSKGNSDPLSFEFAYDNPVYEDF